MEDKEHGKVNSDEENNVYMKGAKNVSDRFNN